MSTTDAPTLPGVVPAGGLLGDRRLVAVQCIDIGRLQSDVVPLARAGLVGITGQGPIDSNGSSKTTFLAALDLLGMSYAWRPGSRRTGTHARGLVLDIDGARSPVGYVLGWWCGPDGTGGSKTTIARIERTGPSPLRIRVLDGCQLADGTTHDGRVAAAGAIWDDTGGVDYSARRYLQVVLGGEPRSAGYVARRGDLPAEATSLFTTELERLSPVQIGNDLLQLTGLEQHVESERDGRRDLAADERALARQRDSHQDLLRDTELRQLERDRRANALAASRVARLARQGWTARRLGDAVARVVEMADQRAAVLAAPDAVAARTAIQQLEQREVQLADDAALVAHLEQCQQVVDELEPAATAAAEAVGDARVERRALERERDRIADRLDPDARSERTVDAVDRDLDRIVDELGEARTTVRLAAKERDRTRARLRRLEAGETTTLNVLRAAGVPAWSLLDDVEPTDGHQQLLDAALDRFTDAVVVAPADHDRAVQLLADRPGTVVVAGDGSGLPDAVTAAPPPAHQLLAALVAAARPVDGPVDAWRVDSPPHTVIGGWGQARVGRSARIAAARVDLEQAEKELEQAEGRVASLEGDLRLLTRERDANQARADHDRAKAEVAAAAARLTQAEADAAAPTAAHRDAQEELRLAKTRVNTRTVDLADVRRNLDQTRRAYSHGVQQPADELLTRARQIPLASLIEATAAIGDIQPAPAPDPADPDRDLCTELAAMAQQVTAAVTEWLEAVAVGVAADWHATDSWRRGATDALRAAGRQLGISFADERGRQRLQASDAVPKVLADAWQRQWDPMRREEADGPVDAAATYLDSWVYQLADAMEQWLVARVEHDEAAAAADQRRLQVSADELVTATDAVEATRASYEAQRDGTIVAVEEQLKEVAAAFAERVAAVDGARATLRVTRLDPDTDGPLRWEVAPAWAAGPDQPPVDFRRARPSTAQSKLKTVQLVLAAFSGRAGRVLILDEVAAAYGSEHFRIVLRGLHDAAVNDQITVLATLQDSHLGPATPLLQQVLFFRFRGNGQVLNDPTVAFVAADGTDADVLDRLATLLDGHRDSSWMPLVDPAGAWDGRSTVAPNDARGIGLTERPDGP